MFQKDGTTHASQASYGMKGNYHEQRCIFTVSYRRIVQRRLQHNVTRGNMFQYIRIRCSSIGYTLLQRQGCGTSPLLCSSRNHGRRDDIHRQSWCRKGGSAIRRNLGEREDLPTSLCFHGVQKSPTEETESMNTELSPATKVCCLLVRGKAPFGRDGFRRDRGGRQGQRKRVLSRYCCSQGFGLKPGRAGVCGTGRSGQCSRISRTQVIRSFDDTKLYGNEK
jgi:hypothetical protein